MIGMIALGAGALVAGVLGYAATRPDSFTVQRSRRIKAPPDRIFPHLVDFRRWTEWSPWEGYDPNMTKKMSGAASGRGAVYEWEGNKKVGKGRMEILDTDPPKRVRIQLDFFSPWEAHNTTEFVLMPQGDFTEVNWRMQGPSPYMSKLFGVFMNTDKLVGRDFEKGLDNLQRITEA